MEPHPLHLHAHGVHDPVQHRRLFAHAEHDPGHRGEIVQQRVEDRRGERLQEVVGPAASQLHHAIAKNVYKGALPETVVYVGNKEVGRFMREKVFNPGKTMTWNELTRFATGSDLNAEAFAQDFKGK